MCRELPLEFGFGRTGALDNFFVTPSGGLMLVEAKLWRNPKARRVVVAQAMEYAGSMFRLSFQELENAVVRARKAAGEDVRSLFELATGWFWTGQSRNILSRKSSPTFRQDQI
jgi:hypothetical protein